MKLWRSSILFLSIGLGFGVYYREISKIFDFSGDTVLTSLHVHALVLGTLVSLIILLFDGVYHVTQVKNFNRTWFIYSFGVYALLVMNTLRGTIEVMQLELSRALDMSIAGIAGLAHMTLGLGFVLLLLAIKKSLPNK